MTAAPLRCPSCGAPADEDAGSCAYCGATLAVVGCPECFAHCFAGMRYCPKCGAKVARSEEGAAPITCPDGHGALVTVRIGIITVAECGGCRGLWLDAELFARIIDDQVTRANVLRWHAGSDASLVAPTAAAIHYRPCPRCTKLMNRVNFARVSKVIVDVCKAHGTWFDRDELARVVTFIQEGGLARANEVQLEQQKEEKRRLSEQMKAIATMKADASHSSIGAFRADDSSARGPIERLIELFGS